MLADEGFKEFVEYRNIGIGAILVLFVIIWPRGIICAIEENLFARLRRRSSATAATDPADHKPT